MRPEYFSELNYTLSNEDTQIEHDLLKENVERVFSISGSGARCLPLLAKNPQVLDIVDMSIHQLYLAELRVQAVKTFNYEEFLFFLGYRGATQNSLKSCDCRFDLFLKLKLSQPCQNFWLESKNQWIPRGFIHLGKWERHFQKLGFIFREILQCNFSPVFEAQNLEEQQKLYEKHWPIKRWTHFLRLAASEYVFNRFLYKGHFSGEKNKKTETRSPYQFILEEFSRVFQTQLVRKNYFFQILFLGKIQFEEGLPFEAHQNIFDQMKNATTRVNYIHGNLLEVLTQNQYDFISLSDTISYLPEKESADILQTISNYTTDRARIVIRSFLRKPPQLNSKGWNQLLVEQEWAHRNDGTAVYEFDIFEKTTKGKPRT